MSKQVMVTGGAGFIGSHLVDLLLLEGYQVVVVDDLRGGHAANLDQHVNNPNLQVATVDILSADLVPDLFQNVDIVFHLAGIGDIVPSIERPSDYMEVNIQGTVRVLECARQAKVKKLVYAASSSCYGLADVPTSENNPINTLYPYALSKYLGEQVCLHWSRLYDLNVNVIRIFNAYGTRVRTTGAYGAVFGVFLRQKLEGKPLTVVGDGEQTRDFVYVTDVAKAFYLAGLTHLKNRIYNVGASNPQSINYLVSLLGCDAVNLPDRPGEPRCTWANTDLIRNELGWHPMVNFEEGIDLMLQDINQWKDAPLWDAEKISHATEPWFRYMSQKS